MHCKTPFRHSERDALWSLFGRQLPSDLAREAASAEPSLARGDMASRVGAWVSLGDWRKQLAQEFAKLPRSSSARAAQDVEDRVLNAVQELLAQQRASQEEEAEKLKSRAGTVL